MEATRSTTVEADWLAQRLARVELEATLPPPEPFDWRAWRLNRAELATRLADRWRLFPHAFPQAVDD